MPVVVAISLRSPVDDAPPRHASRLRDLFDLSLLGSDLDTTVRSFVDRVTLTFRASDCVIWGPTHDAQWPRMHRDPTDDAAQAMLLARCEIARTCDTTVIADLGCFQFASVAAMEDAAPGAT